MSEKWIPSTQSTGNTSVDRPVSPHPAMNTGGPNTAPPGLTPQQKCNLQADLGTTPRSGPSGGDRVRRCNVCQTAHQPFCHQSNHRTEDAGLCRTCGKRHFPYCKRAWGTKGGKSGGDAALSLALKDMADRSAGADVALRDLAEQNAELQEALREKVDGSQILANGVVAADTIMEGLRSEVAELRSDITARDAALEEESAAISKDHFERDVAMVVKWEVDAPKAWWTALAMAAVPAITLGVGCAITYGLTKQKYGMYESSGAWKMMALGVVAVAAQTLAIRLTNKLCALWGYRSLWGERPVHTLAAVSRMESDTQDRRSDMMSMREMKHAKAKYQWFDVGYSASGVNLNRNAFGERTNKPVRALVSMELLRQISVPSVTLSEDVITCRQRASMIAKSTHTVNLDAEMYKREGCDVVTNTIDLVVGLWEQHRQSRSRFV
jgi:hypothetical protein